jgi:hypothetical protein
MSTAAELALFENALRGGGVWCCGYGVVGMINLLVSSFAWSFVVFRLVGGSNVCSFDKQRRYVWDRQWRFNQFSIVWTAKRDGNVLVE